VGLVCGFFYSAFSQVILVSLFVLVFQEVNLHIKKKEHSSSLFSLPNAPHLSSISISNVVLINMKSSNKIQVSLRKTKGLFENVFREFKTNFKNLS